ncbi:MAG TPA: VOC family protein, partial [Acidimicrobiales bacterium]|nr:VOC family protein [Acidimicrobiales bacterium]
LRPERIELAVRDRSSPTATQRDTEIVGRIASAVEGLGHRPAGAASPESHRPVEMLELAIDALDIPTVRPFWKAVLDYVDEPGAGPDGGIIDPAGQLPSVWFQQMDEPRPQRNRVHFDVTVAHDEADARVAAALAAGGRLLDDSHARAYWVLADAEGNEACVCTWTDRDPVGEDQ